MRTFAFKGMAVIQALAGGVSCILFYAHIIRVTVKVDVCCSPG